MSTTSPNPKVTIVYHDTYGGPAYVRHVRMVSHGRKEWTMGRHLVQAVYVPKGKRREERLTQLENHSLVVLEGWVKVDIPALWEDGVVTENGTVKTERAGLFADDWRRESAAAVVASGATVIANYRSNVED